MSGAEIQIKTNTHLQTHYEEQENKPQEGLDQKQKKEEEMVSFFALFRFATNVDILMMIVGSIGAAASGAALPFFVILWGDMTNNFGQSTLEQKAKDTMITFFYIGAGAFVAGWCMICFWIITGQRQSIACRKEYLRSLLKQEIGWFDIINQSQLATKFGTDCFAFQGAIGEKVSTLIMVFAMFITGFVIAFIYGWLMTLVVFLSLPVIAFGGYLFMKANASKDIEQQKNYSQAGGQVEQAIGSIKTVKQLNGEQFEATNYAETLTTVTQKSIKYGVMLGIGIGTLFFAMVASYSLGFWYGSHCVEGSGICPAHLNGGSSYQAGDTLIIFFSILMAGFNLSQLTPSLKMISEGRVAAFRIFAIIDREPLIRSRENCIIPSTFNGVFRFERVSFAYPKDKSRKILDNFDLEINCRFSAFVGESGCGKSTIFQLLMRFYDPDEGRILLDGVDLRDLDLYWLRSQIGYVGQEPVLFATTIKENLLFGNQNATQSEMLEALQKAEALDFVEQLQDKLETYVGMGGGQMSGGQKQRLGIARALLKNPKILLLDEATSALDRRNEKLIQATLNQISKDKITITIAHRVRTIMRCQQIVVMESGKAKEQGRFKQLRKFSHLNIEEEEEKEAQEDKEKVEKKEEKKRNGTNNKIEEKNEKKEKAEGELLKKYENQTFSRLFAYTAGNKVLFFLGLLACFINGLIFPAFSIFLSKMLAVLVTFSNNPSQSRTDANLYALIFLLLAILAFIVNTIQFTIFTYIGQSMTQKIRNQTYLKILKMPVPWFDKPENASGSLANRLASDCHTINQLIITFIPIIFQSLFTLIAGVVIAFIYEWRTALVALGLMPFLIISGAIEMSFSEGFSDKTDKVYKESSDLITESMNSIRTVTSFGSENIIQRKYSSRLIDPQSQGIRKGVISGLLFGLNKLIMFYVFGLIFYLGIVFLSHNYTVTTNSIADVFTAIYGITFSGMTAGNNSHFMPDVASGKKAAASVFQIQDSLDQDQLQEKDQSKMIKTPIKGAIEIQNVSFKYQSRDQIVLKNLNLSIKVGQKIGFVGPSGCGKSTVHQLLQRFYDPTEGTILIDGINIKDYDVHFLRANLGVVSQEPVLFNETIANNIKYNKADASREEIVVAADEANFNPQKEAIQVVNEENNKPSKGEQKQKEEEKKEKKDGTGFEKNVGVKGSHISGGQKQRVAIARAILRSPKVLLLDEATSALDSANEKKVQDSLDELMKGKTSITIAHRIQTIKNSDQIMVFYHGNVSQVGTYSELMERRGHFYRIEQGLELI